MLLQFSRDGRNLNMDKIEKIAIIDTKDFFFQVNYSLSDKTCSITAHNYLNTHNYTIDEDIKDRELAIEIIRYLTLSEEKGNVIYNDLKEQITKGYFI